MIGRVNAMRLAAAGALWAAPLGLAQTALDQDLYQSQPSTGRLDTYAGRERPINSVNTYGGQYSNVNPMGDGRLLDRNLSLTTRYNATRRTDPLQEMRFRSAVVTGNAPGGLSFRGDLGYGSARAFRGDLGSNDLYAFRRDSLYSGLVGAGIRGTDALQYQLSLTTGSTLPRNLVGDLVVEPSFTTRAPAGRGTDAGLEPTVPGEAPALAERQAGTLDEPEYGAGSMHDMLRSTSAYSTSMSLQPVLLNRFGERDEMPDVGVTASPLRGIRLSALPEDEDSPRGRQQVDDSAREAQEVEGAGRVETAYDAVMRRFAEEEQRLSEERAARAEADEQAEAERTWMQRVQELREKLNRGDGEQDAQPREDPGQTPEEDGEDAEASDGLDRLVDLGIYDEETVELLRSAKEPVERLVDPDEALQRRPYVEHMEFGQRLLAQERFFDAEERFTRALGIRAGDVMAQVGRIHAQAGAGMYLSAALNLRVLLLQHPELVGVRYDEKLLPGKARQEAIFDRLREKIGIGPDGGEVPTPDENLKRESGLVLAYLGYQLGDQEAVGQGLDAFEAVTEAHADEAGVDSERRLLELLRRVWID